MRDDGERASGSVRPTRAFLTPIKITYPRGASASGAPHLAQAGAAGGGGGASAWTERGIDGLLRVRFFDGERRGEPIR
jgi:hypothetical protein